MFGWTGNMERLAISNAHTKSQDPQRSYYLNQLKTLEVNPRHPLIIELQRRVEDNSEDEKAKDIALMMFRTGMVNNLYGLFSMTTLLSVENAVVVIFAIISIYIIVTILILIHELQSVSKYNIFYFIMV